jgi:methionine-gamma-lyase
MGNPTIRMLEDNLAVLEGAAQGFACSSGIGAFGTLVFALLNAGDHLLATDAVYGPTRTTVEEHWSRFGIQYDFIDTADLEEVRRALKPNTRLLFVETPANPTLKVSDIAGCAELASNHGALFVVDNTFMSPILQRPLALGADVVMHSVTKFINGHSDVVGGIILTHNTELAARIRPVWFSLGATMDPHQAWLVLRGIKTLKLRVLAAQESAMQIAEYLAGHSAVEHVYYPGLPNHPQRRLQQRQADGPGSLISFELKGGTEAGTKLMNSVRLMTLAVSLGGVESLIQHPASMTHAGMRPEQRANAGIADGLVRLSVGCEDVEDLLDDLEHGLQSL